MDPNTCLDEIRTLTATILDAEEGAGTEFAAQALADNVAALDQWLSRGGFKPDSWA